MGPGIGSPPPDFANWDGKTPISVKLHGDPKKAEKAERSIADMIYSVAYFYPQYTIEQLFNDTPMEHVQMMYKTAQRERATEMMMLNVIINGPQSKNKSGYKKLMKNLGKQLEE